MGRSVAITLDLRRRCHSWSTVCRLCRADVRSVAAGTDGSMAPRQSRLRSRRTHRCYDCRYGLSGIDWAGSQPPPLPAARRSSPVAHRPPPVVVPPTLPCSYVHRPGAGTGREGRAGTRCGGVRVTISEAGTVSEAAPAGWVARSRLSGLRCAGRAGSVYLSAALIEEEWMT